MTAFPLSHKYGPLAQLVEQLAFNQLVAGSNPARPTKYKKKLTHQGGLFFVFVICT